MSRKFYAGFCSSDREKIGALRKHVGRELWPIREIGTEDTDGGRIVVLRKRLARSEFNAPILEHYEHGSAFFGIYDATQGAAARIHQKFCDRAVAFFQDVVGSLPKAGTDERPEVYPKYENRKRVVSHLRRERSRLLAIERKILDDYECQVCGLRLEVIYGRLARNYAEAHHITPLYRLKENVQTRLEDLRTVCPNCHRVLHLMEGEADDMDRLRKIVQSARRK